MTCSVIAKQTPVQRGSTLTRYMALGYTPKHRLERSMPKQEIFFEQQSGARTIEVLKSYDQSYAREAFKNMDEEACDLQR